MNATSGKEEPTRSTSNPETIEAHYDAIAEVYEGNLGTETINQRHLESCLEAFRSALGLDYGREVGIELGAGTGLFTEMMSSSFNQLIAIDISQRMLDILASKLAHSRISNVTLLKADVMNLDKIPSASADVVYYFGLLEHMKSPQEQFREAARLLKRGGRIVGVVSNAQCPYYVLRRLLPSSRTFFENVRLYRKGEIMRCAAAAGLNMSVVRYWGLVPAQLPNGMISEVMAFVERIVARTPLAMMLGGIAFRCERPLGDRESVAQ